MTNLATFNPVIGLGPSPHLSTTTISGIDFHKLEDASLTLQIGERPRVYAVIRYEADTPRAARPPKPGNYFFLEEPHDPGSSFAVAEASSAFYYCVTGLRKPTIIKEERLDWDAFVESPSTRRTGSVAVTLQFAGRAKPLPVDADWY